MTWDTFSLVRGDPRWGEMRCSEDGSLGTQPANSCSCNQPYKRAM